MLMAFYSIFSSHLSTGEESISGTRIRNQQSDIFHCTDDGYLCALHSDWLKAKKEQIIIWEKDEIK